MRRPRLKKKRNIEKCYVTVEAELEEIRLKCAKERYKISKRHGEKEYIV